MPPLASTGRELGPDPRLVACAATASRTGVPQRTRRRRQYMAWKTAPRVGDALRAGGGTQMWEKANHSASSSAESARSISSNELRTTRRIMASPGSLPPIGAAVD